jgi:hypothetical protein
MDGQTDTDRQMVWVEEEEGEEELNLNTIRDEN